MKIHRECVPCLLKRIIFETEQNTKDETLQTKVIRETCRILSEIYNPKECSATIATIAHREAYKLLRDKDPYRKLKQRSNEIAKSLLLQVEKLIQKSSDALEASILCSIIGNTLDFGIEGGSKNPEMLKKSFDTLFKEGLGYSDTDIFKKLLIKSKHILFFTDNCGEIFFDRSLLQEIKRFNPNLFITVVVKGEPVLSDATLEDAYAADIDKVADEITTTGCFAVGLDFNCIPSKLREYLKTTDLIVCKGMANYEVFSETNYKPIVYLLRTKCNPIASSMNLPKDINAIKVYQ